MKRTRRRGRHAQHVATELEIMPMLNVFISIIPLLLLSAAFVPVSVIQATLPAGAVAGAEPASQPLDLEVVIRPTGYVVQGHGIGPIAIARVAGDPAGRAELEELLRRVAAEHPDNHEVRIVSGLTTRYEEIIDVMDVARAAGLPEAALADDGGEAS